MNSAKGASLKKKKKRKRKRWTRISAIQTLLTIKGINNKLGRLLDLKKGHEQCQRS